MLDGIDITAAFENVVAALNTLCLHVHDELTDYPVWIDNGSGELINDRDKVLYALKHFEPTAGLSPQQTFACVGAVAGTTLTLDLVDKVNLAKDTFKLLVDDYLKDDENRDTSVIRRLLAFNGYPGIKLRQVFRHIRSINFHPRRISFTQGRHNSHRIISKQQAEQMLKAIGQGLHIEIQLAKLNMLEPDARLVIHRDVQSYWLANIATFKDANGHSTSFKLPSSLPVFYRHDQHLPETQVLFSKKNHRYKLAARTDKRIEDQVFLSSISAYRYR